MQVQPLGFICYFELKLPSIWLNNEEYEPIKVDSIVT